MDAAIGKYKSQDIIIDVVGFDANGLVCKFRYYHEGEPPSRVYYLMMTKYLFMNYRRVTT